MTNVEQTVKIFLHCNYHNCSCFKQRSTHSLTQLEVHLVTFTSRTEKLTWYCKIQEKGKRHLDIMLVKIKQMQDWKGIILQRWGWNMMLVVSHSVSHLPHSFLACLLVIIVVFKHRICNEGRSVARTQHYPAKRHREIIHSNDRN